MCKATSLLLLAAIAAVMCAGALAGHTTTNGDPMTAGCEQGCEVWTTNLRARGACARCCAGFYLQGGTCRSKGVTSTVTGPSVTALPHTAGGPLSTTTTTTARRALRQSNCAFGCIIFLKDSFGNSRCAACCPGFVFRIDRCERNDRRFGRGGGGGDRRGSH